MPGADGNTSALEGAPLVHGASELPSVLVDDYNNELRDKDGFVGDRARKAAFQEKLDAWRKRIRKGGTDPLGDTATEDFSKKQLDRFVQGEDKEAAALVMSAIDDFAAELVGVLERYLKQKAWAKTERVAIGGGFKESEVGKRAIAKAQILLNAQGKKVQLCPIRHHPDDAGLIGSIHLMPAWMLRGSRAILAVDIGGTNIRAGIVEFDLDDDPACEKAHVTKSTLWRHADESPSRTSTIAKMVEMIEGLIAKAEKAKLAMAPVIGVACPGIIDANGAIDRGGQNLPGGNWESDHFNLPAALLNAIPTVCGQQCFVIMHNDAVVQGLSQIPFMRDVERWGILTIGTGLGNAHFHNTDRPVAGG
jgi:predicted NBD/HSP70 family sugar kinase